MDFSREVTGQLINSAKFVSKFTMPFVYMIDLVHYCCEKVFERGTSLP